MKKPSVNRYVNYLAVTSIAVFIVSLAIACGVYYFESRAGILPTMLIAFVLGISLFGFFGAYLWMRFYPSFAKRFNNIALATSLSALSASIASTALISLPIAILMDSDFTDVVTNVGFVVAVGGIPTGLLGGALGVVMLKDGRKAQ